MRTSKRWISSFENTQAPRINNRVVATVPMCGTACKYFNLICVHADDDECVSLNETCLDENAHCVNSPGNFSCQCDPGFTGDGYNCTGQLLLNC